MFVRQLRLVRERRPDGIIERLHGLRVYQWYGREARFHLQSFNNCLAITSLWISLVPSPIVHSFTSR